MKHILLLLLLLLLLFSLPCKSNEWLAKNAFFEARNAKHLYQMLTVVQVVENRRKLDTYWGNTYKAVLTYNCEFSWYCDGKPDDPSKYINEQDAWISSQVVANLVGEFPDITQGATYYHASNIEVPRFFKKLEFLFDDGLHKFYKEKN